MKARGEGDEADQEQLVVSALIGVWIVFLLGVPIPVHASACSATGKFAFTIGAGSGRLVLECGFTLDVQDAEGLKVSIIGVVAFQGSVLLFQAATVPSFGPGLALRSDTLTGQ